MLTEILAIYSGSDGDATRALYTRLSAVGPAGVVAVNLFRACKTSERAKKYRGGNGRGSYRSQAYQTKQWSIDNLCRALDVHAAALAIRWGWAIDRELLERGDPHHHILYVDMPTGDQVSFHSGVRGPGPDYLQPWDGVKGMGGERICRWIATLIDTESKVGSAA